MKFELPYTLLVDGEEKEIYCDFRDIITICNALNDSEVPENEKPYILLNNLYVDDFTQFKNKKEALAKANWFIDWGKEYENKNNSPKIMDWQQDYNFIISAVNAKANVLDVRDLPFLHWWTFLGYFSECGECQFSNITSIREKIAKGKKLEKWEREILLENRGIIVLQDKENDDAENELWR